MTTTSGPRTPTTTIGTTDPTTVRGLRSRARTLNPEPFDPGQPVEVGGVTGTVWSLGPDVNSRVDTRWVACDDGVVRVLRLYRPSKGVLKADGFDRSWDYLPRHAA